VVRQTFSELNLSIRLDGLMQNLKLLLDEDRTPSKSIEISVVYFRTGYDAQDYEDPHNYNIRILLERSLAIKCPSIPLQLAGSKKVQQILSEPGVLESFISDKERWHTDDDMFEKEDLDLLRATWVSMFALDEDDSPINPGGANDPVGEKPTPVETSGVRKARELASSLVLKPQREGGGHNVFTDDIPAFLNTLPPEKRAAWIAQEKIIPPQGMGNIMMRAEDEIRTPIKIETVNELGIFGWNLHHLVRRMREKEAGWLLRTKNKNDNEGGVAAGFSGLDSLLLVDD
jgi:glutathione synthase